MPTPEITYNPKAGRYVYADSKRFVPKAVIQHLVATEQQQLGVRLQGVTRLLATGKIDLPTWQTRFADTLKAAHLRLAALAAGGKTGLSPQHYGATGYQLAKQYEYLDRFARQLAAGQVSVAQAMRRSRLYASSAKLTYNRAEQITRQGEGFLEAKRVLDAQAQHCADCLRYSTKGRWVPANQVTLPATACACGQFCKCQIYYRKSRSLSAPLPGVG